MNKKFSSLYAVTLLILTGFISCKKDLDKPSIHEISYEITADNYEVFTQVIYTNSGDSISNASNFNSAAGFPLKVTESVKPFTAKLGAIINNTSNKPVNYTLKIFVDGILKAQQQGLSQPNKWDNQETQYDIND